MLCDGFCDVCYGHRRFIGWADSFGQLLNLCCLLCHAVYVFGVLSVDVWVCVLYLLCSVLVLGFQ